MLFASLLKIYDEREANNIAKYYFEDKFGKGGFPAENELFAILNKDLVRFEKKEPYQYIVNKAYFLNHPFYVDERVLIPRPETEELASLIIKDMSASGIEKISMLDIGCGSGCIAISIGLATKIEASITGIDISVNALEVAKHNAKVYNSSVNLIQMDFLNSDNWPKIPAMNVIISNPPYIDLPEKEQMEDNVLNYEPTIALFADPPLKFYSAIADFAVTQNVDSVIYCECNPRFIKETVDVFVCPGFRNHFVIDDLQGKPRFLKVEYKASLA